MKTINLNLFVRSFSRDEYESLFFAQNPIKDHCFNYLNHKKVITQKYLLLFSYILPQRLLAFDDFNFNRDSIKGSFHFERASMGYFVKKHETTLRELISRYVPLENAYIGFELVKITSEHFASEYQVNPKDMIALSVCTLIMLLAYRAPLLTK